MSEFRDDITDEQLDAYLDGRMTRSDALEFEGRLEENHHAQRGVDACRELESKLRREFAPPKISVADIERLLPPTSSLLAGPTKDGRRNRRLLLILSAIAAAAIWAVVGWQQFGGRPNKEPFFEPRSLVEIYRETVERGFRPYYFCEDEERFALTFAKRQRVPLQLAKTPDDRRMIGLSYSGGLSRDTTSILCYVRNEPVMVFVDQRQFDRPAIVSEGQTTGALFVHRAELGDLVLYEVSPFEAPEMTEFLE